MTAGSIMNWLDQGPALLLQECEVPMPCSEEDLGDMLADPSSWPTDPGWTIKLLETGEILDVHTETLENPFPLNVRGIKFRE